VSNEVDHVVEGLEYESLSVPAYTPHAPIVIGDNSEFTSEGFTGYGNSTHPYILEGVEIVGGPWLPCIMIADTNASFVIRNCSFEADWDMGAGVALSNVSNGRVEEFGRGILTILQLQIVLSSIVTLG
jgi:hypothetical protein